MILSIVTVVFNDRENLRKTVDSLSTQTFKNFEYIVIDGRSVDGTLELIQEKETYISKWVSEKDQGIYDAMNKGLKKSSGDYILFLNAGDTFPDTDTLQKVSDKIEKNNFPDFIYGDAYETDLKGKFFLRLSRQSSHKTIGMFTHHQSMYYKREVIVKYDLKYDITLKIAADYKFTCQFLEYARSELYITKPLSMFLQGGLSQLQWQKSMKEQIIVKKNVLKMPFLRIYIIYFLQIGWHIIKDKLPWIYEFIRFKR